MLDARGVTACGRLFERGQGLPQGQLLGSRVLVGSVIRDLSQLGRIPQKDSSRARKYAASWPVTPITRVTVILATFRPNDA